MSPDEQEVNESGQEQHSVRLMTKQNQLKLEFKAPRPSWLRISEHGLAFTRGEEPQDDSVLAGRGQITISWSEIDKIRYNSYLHAAIKIQLLPASEFGPRIWVQWLNDLRLAPYSRAGTQWLYDEINEAFELAVRS